jgi:hypothetical protein
MASSPAPPQGHLTAANLYSLPQYLVPNKKVQGGKCAIIGVQGTGLCNMLDMDFGE